MRDLSVQRAVDLDDALAGGVTNRRGCTRGSALPPANSCFPRYWPSRNCRSVPSAGVRARFLRKVAFSPSIVQRIKDLPMTWPLNSAKDTWTRRTSACCAGSAILKRKSVGADAMKKLVEILVEAVVKG
jgi:hypothetical protein